MLRLMCGHARKDRVRNDDVLDRVGVAPIKEKLVKHHLRLFGHIQRRSSEARCIDKICQVLLVGSVCINDHEQRNRRRQ